MTATGTRPKSGSTASTGSGGAGEEGGEESRIAALLHTPAVIAAREALAKAVEEVRLSLAHLQQAPMAEKPVVASIEALHLARAALATVATAVGGAIGVSGGGAAGAGAGEEEHSATGIAGAITAARERASSAVSEAATTLSTLRERIASGTLDLATTVAASGVDLAVRGAAALDHSLSVTERVKAVDAAYNVTQRVSDAYATVSTVVADINKKYGVEDTAAAVLERAKTLDASVTKGYGATITTAAVASASSLATSATEYAKTVVNKYEAVKAGYVQAEGTSPAGGAPVSPSGTASGSGSAGAAAATAQAAASASGAAVPVSLEGLSMGEQGETAAASKAEPVTL